MTERTLQDLDKTEEVTIMTTKAAACVHLDRDCGQIERFPEEKKHTAPVAEIPAPPSRKVCSFCGTHTTQTHAYSSPTAVLNRDDVRSVADAVEYLRDCVEANE